MQVVERLTAIQIIDAQIREVIIHDTS